MKINKPELIFDNNAKLRLIRGKCKAGDWSKQFREIEKLIAS